MGSRPAQPYYLRKGQVAFRRPGDINPARNSMLGYTLGSLLLWAVNGGCQLLSSAVVLRLLGPMGKSLQGWKPVAYRGREAWCKAM
jgi:hypothetical protein